MPNERPKYEYWLINKHLKNGAVLCYHEPFCRMAWWAGECDCHGDGTPEETARREAVAGWMYSLTMRWYRCDYTEALSLRCQLPRGHSGEHWGYEHGLTWSQDVAEVRACP